MKCNYFCKHPLSKCYEQIYTLWFMFVDGTEHVTHARLNFLHTPCFGSQNMLRVLCSMAVQYKYLEELGTFLSKVMN